MRVLPYAVDRRNAWGCESPRSYVPLRHARVDAGAQCSKPLHTLPQRQVSGVGGADLERVDRALAVADGKLANGGAWQSSVALVPRLACEAIDHPGDAGSHSRVRFGACFLIFPRDLASQDHPSAGDIHLYTVARNGQIPVKRCHDGELDALVAPLPIMFIVGSELEFRGKVGRAATGNTGLACLGVRLFTGHRRQL